MSRNFVTIEGRVLAAALRSLLPLVQRRVSVPILGMVELEVAGSYLVVSGTDLDLEVDLKLDVIDAGGDWSVCVSPFVLHSVARLAGSAELVMERTDAGISVTVDQDTVYELDGLSSDDFPRIGLNRGRLLESFGNGRLTELLAKVAWCASTEETRYYLNGVAWLWKGGSRRFAATDGHRLAIARYGETSEDAVRIISNKAVAFLRGIGPTASIYEMTTGGEADPLKLLVEAPGMTIRMKLVEPATGFGYPDVDRVIPRQESYKASFAVRQLDLMDGIRRAMVLDIDRRGLGRALTIANHNGRISIGGKHQDYGVARVALPADWPEEAETFGVNGRYLRDLVQRCVGQLTIHQVDPGAPITVVDEDEQMTRVLMPMRV